MKTSMEIPFVADEIDEMKDVELNDVLPSDAKDSQDVMKDISKKDEVNKIVTTTDNVDDEEKVDKVGLNNEDVIPRVGMVFRTYDEASNFYKEYALRVGFGVAVKKSSFSKSGVCRRLILGCSRGGRGRADACYLARQTAKTNCEAMVAVKLWGDGLLHVVDAKLEHNHPVSPSTAQFLRCYQKMAHTMNLVQQGGHRNSHLVNKDCASMTEIGRLKLGEGDDEAIHQFFARMQNKNPKFFYSVDMDQHGRMKNLFWADARSRAANRYFGDVVAFDTTCLTEKQDLPLASFVGVNHHGQSVLLGCGLLSNETVETYVWFFKTWLTCMMSCHPNAIITDLCKPIQDAVAEVFPGTRHRVCLYNVMKKVPEMLRGHEELKAIKKELKKLVYDSLRAYEFEHEWKKMIKKFVLEDNEWLDYLYNNRHSWVPLFLKDTFWAGMSVAQRGEKSLSTYFEGCVFPRTTVKHFFGKYETIIQSKCKKEAQADSESFHKTPLIASKFYMEEQLSKLYTINMFQKFQDELKATMYCHASPVKIDGSIHIFEVKECSYIENGKQTESKDHEVFFNAEELTVQCICGFFQFNGILCRHSLSVFKLQQVFEIPSHYILNRWKKDFKRLHTLANYTDDIVPENLLDRHDYLSMRFLQLVEVGFLSEDRYHLTLKLIRELEKVLLDDPGCRDRQSRLLSFESQPSQCVQQDLLASRFVISDCNKSQSSLQTKRRGRPQKKFDESNIETLVRTNKEQDFLRSSLLQNENPVLQAASTSLHQNAHIGSQGGIDLMEEVNQNEISFGTHFGMHVNQEQIGGQARMQPSNLFQVQYEQQALGTPTRMPWLYHQIYQEDQIPKAPSGRRNG